MQDTSRIRPQSVLLSFRFLGPALIGSLVMALVCAFAPVTAQLAVLGSLISILGGLFISYIEQETERDQRRNEVLEKLTVPLALARDAELFDQFKAYCKEMSDLSNMADPILPPNGTRAFRV